MKKLILAIDQGTTATTVLAIDEALKVVAKESTEILPTYPQYGWVEHSLDQIWDGTLLTIQKLLKNHKIDPGQIAGIGITNQRETVGAWNRKNFVPQANAIVWQCRRTAPRCEELKKKPGLEEKIKQKTGLVLDPYFSGTKIEWLLQNVPGLKDKAAKGDIAFGTIDCFLLYRMTFGAVHATDVSNASRTMLMDLRTLDWDNELLELFSVPRGALPKICSCSEIYGYTKNMQVLPDGIPIAGILGDQQAALFGQLCLEAGEAKCTYGTGSFLICNTGTEINYSKNGLITTVAWKMSGKTAYALEGSAFVAGAAVQFLRDNLGIIKSSSEVEPLALEAKEKDMGDLVFVPALTGLGAPYWDANAKGMIYGLTRGTTRAHIARATLEGIALQNDDLISAIQEDLGQNKKLRSIKVDGGASANNLLMQLQCDLAGIPIQRPKILDTTAFGAALAAGLAVGFWKNVDDLRASWMLDAEFKPKMEAEEKKKMRTKWDRAIKAIRGY